MSTGEWADLDPSLPSMQGVRAESATFPWFLSRWDRGSNY
jgi:hypothetical protein